MGKRQPLDYFYQCLRGKTQRGVISREKMEIKKGDGEKVRTYCKGRGRLATVPKKRPPRKSKNPFLLPSSTREHPKDPNPGVG